MENTDDVASINSELDEYELELEWPDMLDYSIFDLVLSNWSKASLQTRTRASLHRQRLRAAITPSLREKIAFCIGVLGMWSLAWLLGRYPALVSTWYSVGAVLLVSIRFPMYRKTGWHYFLADLCYFANFLMLLWLFVFPHSRVLYIGMFALTNGPVAIAIIAWRNSMVFHSLDKITSLFIHMAPGVTLYALRWLCPNTDDDEGGTLKITHGTNVLGGANNMTFLETMIYGLMYYTIWQTLYFFGIMVLKQHKIDAGTRITSYSWLLNPEKNVHRKNLMYRLCTIPDWGAGRYQLVLFVFWQFLYAVLTILPTSLYYTYWQLHLLFLTAVGVTSVWNGANFYIEVFRHAHTKRPETSSENNKAASDKA